MAVASQFAGGPPAPAALRWLAARPWRAALLIFMLSLSIQGCLLTKVPADWVRPNTRWELPSIAVSLATTGEFANAYALPTGPTAHLPPIHPALYGLIYWLFGLTVTAGYAAWLVDMATSAALWAMLPWAAARLGLSPPAGVLAGFAAALVPRLPGHGEALAAVAMCLLTVAFARRWTSGPATPRGSLALGVAAGVACHVQPALLTVIASWLVYELGWLRRCRRPGLTLLVVVGIVLACVPWGWRNYRALHALFFVRSNFGLELRMGNHEGASASMDAMDRAPGHVHVHPRASVEEARKVQLAGEVGYMRAAGREALGWIAVHPGEFARLTAMRVAYWWLGPLYDPPTGAVFVLLTALALCGAWRVRPALPSAVQVALLVPPLAYPLVYYVVAYMPRYREPLDWVFVLAAAHCLWRVGNVQETQAMPVRAR